MPAGADSSVCQDINSPDTLILFQEFLKKEFSEENIVFWIACERFQSITNYEEVHYFYLLVCFCLFVLFPT